MFSWITAELAKHRELRQLAAEASHRPRPIAPQLIGLDPYKATWLVPIPADRPRYMQATAGAIQDEIFVVMVDGEAFYHAWLRCSPSIRKRRGADCILRADMPADYKYKWAADGFSHGLENPVPLATCGAFQEGKGVGIGFTNGVTRTFWLLAHRAPAFPVEVYGRESAELLNQVAGIEAAPMSFAELFQPAKLEHAF